MLSETGPQALAPTSVKIVVAGGFGVGKTILTEVGARACGPVSESM